MPPAPRILSHAAVYRRSGRGPQPPRVLSPGDLALFTLRFLRIPRPYSDNEGWDAPSSRVIVRKEEYPFVESCVGKPGQDGVIYVSPTMRRKRLPNGYSRFSMEVTIGESGEWVGHRLVMFLVTNGRGTVGIYLPGGIDVVPPSGS